MNRQGLVVARHRREAAIETADGRVLRALVRGRVLRPVTGDQVEWHELTDGTVIIEKVLPRSSLLERIDSRGRAEGVAANVSALVIVVAPRPAPDWTLVDRYLIAAELLGIAALIVRNKTDMADRSLEERCETYADVGYEVISTSTKPASGLDELSSVLQGQRSVLVGQSGVGKSSLLNELLGNDAQAVGALSERSELGRHTTTAAMLYRLPGGGELIDSPGVRRYAPNIPSDQDLAWGFRDLRPYLEKCRFNDCSHRQEPGCAVREALKHGRIKPERYASYLALRTSLESLNRN